MMDLNGLRARVTVAASQDRPVKLEPSQVLAWCDEVEALRLAHKLACQDANDPARF